MSKETPLKGKAGSTRMDKMILEAPSLESEKSHKEEGDKTVQHTLNTITIGFTRDRETNSAQRRYGLYILNIEDLPTYPKEGETKRPEVEIDFLKKDVVGVHPHNDNPMVMIVK